jgi:hypothetical protein
MTTPRLVRRSQPIRQRWLLRSSGCALKPMHPEPCAVISNSKLRFSSSLPVSLSTSFNQPIRRLCMCRSTTRRWSTFARAQALLWQHRLSPLEWVSELESCWPITSLGDGVGGDGVGEAMASTTTMGPGAAGTEDITRLTSTIARGQCPMEVVLVMVVTGAIGRRIIGRPLPCIGLALGLPAILEVILEINLELDTQETGPILTQGIDLAPEIRKTNLEPAILGINPEIRIREIAQEREIRGTSPAVLAPETGPGVDRLIQATPTFDPTRVIQRGLIRVIREDPNHRKTGQALASNPVRDRHRRVDQHHKVDQHHRVGRHHRVDRLLKPSPHSKSQRHVPQEVVRQIVGVGLSNARTRSLAGGAC